jgi:hypothetical protein
MEVAMDQGEVAMEEDGAAMEEEVVMVPQEGMDMVGIMFHLDMALLLPVTMDLLLRCILIPPHLISNLLQCLAVILREAALFKIT